MNRFFTLLLGASCLNAVGQYEVGDVGPAGGWIFYVDSLDEFDWDFLEVADRAIAATREMNGDSNVSIDGQGLPAELGTGRSNSQKLVANNSAIPQFSAIIQALGCELGGYSDWFIPSFEEMHLVYENVLDLIDEDGDLGNLTADWVWTSSSVWSDIGLIDLMHLMSGNPLGVSANGTNQDFNIRVIPIRSGNIPSEEFCGFGTIWDPTSQSCVVDESACGWQPDGNGDGLVGLSDLLDFLTVYGDTDYDQDGIWDSADDCVGEYDECGVCNGSGPSIPIIESIEILYDSVYAEQIDEWWVFEVGVDTTYQYVCGLGCIDPLAENYNESADTDDGSCVYPWQCGDPLEYQGYEYATVQIGDQCWFAENLRAENYRNGDMIPADLSDSEWEYTTNGAVAVFGEGSTPCLSSAPNGDACDESFSLQEYGRLYNWYAVTDERMLCPQGWRVMKVTDWNTLSAFVETESGIDASLALQSFSGWLDWPGGGVPQDLFGFSILPGGVRKEQSGDWLFEYAGSHANLWTTGYQSVGNPFVVSMNSFETQTLVTAIGSRNGCSVRCIKDTE